MLSFGFVSCRRGRGCERQLCPLPLSLTPLCVPTHTLHTYTPSSLFFVVLWCQMLETERAQVKDLKGKGYSDRQLQELGFSDNALHAPSVASLPKA